MKRLFRSALMIGLLVTAGCASTTESRIDREPDLFASFPPDVQELVRNGQVRVGFEPDMVRLALGEPNRKVIRQAADDQREIWYYEGRYFTLESHDFHDRWHHGRPGAMIHYDTTRETIYDRMQLDFVDGKLVSIEQLER